MLTDAKIRGSSDWRKCRLCFEAENTLVYIYEVGGSLKKIAKSISEVLNHEVSKDDQFPPYICICCCGKLLEFRAFKMKCDSLRETYRFYLTSRQDATKSIEEKVEIEEESVGNDEQLLDSCLIEEKNSVFCISQVEIEGGEKEQLLEDNSAFDNSQVETEEENLRKNEQLLDSCLIEDENSVFCNSQVPIEDEIQQKGQLLDSHVMEENSQGQERSLRCRKAIDYNVDQSGSEASDAESSDWFSPSDDASSDDSVTSDRNKRFCKKRVDASSNSGAAGLGEDQRTCDPGSAVGSSAAISCGRYSVSGTLESSMAQLDEQRGSPRGHNVVGYRPNCSQIVSQVSCVPRAEDGAEVISGRAGSQTTSTEMAEKQSERTTQRSMLYPGISNIDLESFGISLETGDPVPDERVPSQVEHQSLKDLQSSKSGISRFSGHQLTEESKTRCMLVGRTPVHQKKLEEVHKDQRSEADGSDVLETERWNMLSTLEQEDGREVVRNSISNSSQSMACAETPSVVNTSCNASCRLSCGVPETCTSYNNLNQCYNVAQPSLSTRGIPFPSSNTGYSFLRMNYVQNVEKTPIPRAISSLMSSYRMIRPTPPASNPHFSIPISVGNPEAVTPHATGYIPSSPFSAALNPTSAGYGKGSFEYSSIHGRPRTLLHSLPASQLDLLLTESRIPAACTNRSSGVNYLTEQMLPGYLHSLTLPRTPGEISAFAALLLQPESRLKSASKANQLPITTKYIAALNNLAEMKGNSADVNGEDVFLDSASDDGRKRGLEDDSLDSASPAADDGSNWGLEDDVDAEKPVKKKTKERLCDVCGSVFYSAIALRSHKKGVHGEKRFKCEKCPKAFILKHHLAQHMSMHDDSRPFVCKECGSCFKLKTHLRQHLLVHSKKAMFQCSHCEKGFHTKWQHDNHQPSHEGTAVWSCDGCTEKLTTWAAYKNHLLEHKKNRTFKCDMCTNVYDNKISLRIHVMNHIRPLECSLCGKRFGSSKALRYHTRVHTGEKPHICKVCGKGFSTNGVLRVHMKIHSDERPFKCRFCAHSTKHKNDLNRHERRVHHR